MRIPRIPSLFALALGAAAALCTAAASAASVEELLKLNCAGCHTAADAPGGPLTRMSLQRKSPEGWEMTLRRMQTLHKVPFADPDGATPDAVLARLVRHFADSQGLAPAESAPFRYILERRHNTIDTPADAEFAVMCSRCHSAARVGLQRRTEEEWRHLVHFHLAQFPTTEYQAGGRNRNWLDVALTRTVPMLGATYPLETREWSAWQKVAKPDLGGRWRLAGRMPGKGDFDGVLTATKGEDGRFAIALDGQFADGVKLAGSGAALVYTGYEWRATIDANGEQYLQVFAASADGATLAGRMFLAGHEERGIDMRAWKDGGKPQLLAASPAQIKRGTSATLTLTGVALSGKPELGAGLRVDEVLNQDADRVVLKVSADAAATPGPRSLKVGTATLANAFTVYEAIDRVEVTPAYSVGRVGGSEGSQPEVQAQFEALAWGNGADGQPATADDLRIGLVAAQWAVGPWDDKAAADEDAKFAGSMDKDRGVFTPAAAGPNPARKYQTNNAGNLKVLATVQDGERTVNGEGRLLVTVQRWNNPPIR